jgi:phospholipase/carboxylesterase
MVENMNYYEFKPVSGQAPQSIVLLLHGYGSNGQDLISLAPYWAPQLPDTIFISVDAPFPCEVGFGFQWWSLQNWMPQAMKDGAMVAAHKLNPFIDDLLKKFNVPASKLALVGFSQGTMMSLFTAPRRPEPVAGILGYSGALIGGEDLIGSENISKCPVHLIHGDFDPVVPVAAWHHATATLKQAGFDVTGSVTNGLPHSIDEQGIRNGGEFLRRIFVKG